MACATFATFGRSFHLSCLTRANKVKSANQADADYDRVTRELVYESKAHAGERTLMPEQLAAKEAERLQLLERYVGSRPKDAVSFAPECQRCDEDVM